MVMKMEYKTKLLLGLLALLTSSCTGTTDEDVASRSPNALHSIEPVSNNVTNTSQEELPEPESLAWVDPVRLSNQGMIVRNKPSIANLLGLRVVEYKNAPARKQQQTSSSYGRPYTSRRQPPNRPRFETNSHGRPYNYNQNGFNTYNKPNNENYRNRPFLNPNEAFRQQNNIRPPFHSNSLQPKDPRVKSPPYNPAPPSTPPPPLGMGLVNMFSALSPFKPGVIPGDLPSPPRNKNPIPPPNYDPRRPRLENSRPQELKYEPNSFQDQKPINSPNLDYNSRFPETVPYSEDLEPHLGEVSYDYEDDSVIPFDGMEYVRDFPMREDLYIGKDGNIYLKSENLNYRPKKNNDKERHENNYQGINVPNYNTGNDNNLNQIEPPSSGRNPKFNRDRGNYFNQIQRPPYTSGINNFNSFRKPRRPQNQNVPFRPGQRYPTQNNVEKETEYNEREYHKRLKNHNLDGTNNYNTNYISDTANKNNGLNYPKYDPKANSPFNYRFKNYNQNLHERPNYNYGPHNSNLDVSDNPRFRQRPFIPPAAGTPVRWPKPIPARTPSNIRTPHQPPPPRPSQDIRQNRPYNPSDKQPNIPYRPSPDIRQNRPYNPSDKQPNIPSRPSPDIRQNRPYNPSDKQPNIPSRPSPDIRQNRPYNPSDKQPNIPYDYQDEYDNNFYRYDPSEMAKDQLFNTFNKAPEREKDNGFYPGNGFFDADFPTTFHMSPSYNQNRRVLPSGMNNRG